MAIEIKLDDVSMAEVNRMKEAIKNGSLSAIIYATNDSLSGIKTEAAKLASGKVTAKAKVIKARFLIDKMNKANRSAGIVCKGKPEPLINYSARSVMKGVSIKVLQAGVRKVVRHAFIATMASGHTGVFWREKRISGTKWKVGKKMVLPSPETGSALMPYQLKIKERYGPRIPDVFDDPEIMVPTLQHASKRLDDRLEYHTNRLMAKAAQA